MINSSEVLGSKGMFSIGSDRVSPSAFPNRNTWREGAKLHRYSSVDLHLRPKSIRSAIVFVTGRALSAILSTRDYRTGDLRHRSLDVQL
ncbi:hypothetical protein [Desulfosporosinus lacus]|uniref:hypothetical protein n=1 Tax=Desulfosporosinus lacus TaxID=329936 RepID=UPI0011613C56|nr:hypothetical protein [Desulfosporosinus lacus]